MCLVWGGALLQTVIGTLAHVPCQVVGLTCTPLMRFSRHKPNTSLSVWMLWYFPNSRIGPASLASHINAGTYNCDSVATLDPSTSVGLTIYARQ